MESTIPSKAVKSDTGAETEEIGTRANLMAMALAALVGVALVAVPALAAPPQLKVTWDGSGVTESGGMYSGTSYVQGVPIHFAGQAMLNADGTWKNFRGSFESTFQGEPLKVKMKVAEEGDLWTGGGRYYMPRFVGRADVTWKGITYRDVLFSQDFVEYDWYDAWGQCWHHQYFQINTWRGAWYFTRVTTENDTDPIPNEMVTYHWFT